MRAERDDTFPVKTPRQPRLAYEIALGIVLGGVVLMALDALSSYVAAQYFLGKIQLHWPQ